MDVLILSTASEFLWANQGVIKYILTCSYSAEIFSFLTLARKSLWPALKAGFPEVHGQLGGLDGCILYTQHLLHPSHYPALPTPPNILCVKQSHNCKVKLSNSKVLLLNAVGLTKMYLRSAVEL